MRRPERQGVVAPTVAPDLLTVHAAAGRVGVHPETLYRAIRAGEFEPAVRIGGSWRVSVPKLNRLLHGDAALPADATGEA
jgi:excisionase family DNA binding protein